MPDIFNGYRELVQSVPLAYPASPGNLILHRRSGGSAVPEELGQNCSSAAVQGDFVVGATVRSVNQGLGDQYEFFIYNYRTEDYYPADLRFLRPDWMYGGISRTRWYWRGDGKACLSLQYDYYGESYDDEPFLGSHATTHVYIQELSFVVEGGEEGSPVSLAVSSNFATTRHREHSVHPVAVDYDLFDGNIRRALVLEHWIGPLYDGLEDYKPTPAHRFRAILTYAHFCRVNDDGSLSDPEQSFPVYHKPWLVVEPLSQVNENRPEPVGPDFLNVDEFGYWVTPADPHHPHGVSGFYDAFGYHGYAARIAALDVRARAIALIGTTYRELYPPPGELLTAVEYEPRYNKRWTIWGENDLRENTWIDAAGAEFVPAVDPIDALLTPPAGYVRYDRNHKIFWAKDNGQISLWRLMGSGLSRIHEEIMRNLVPGDRTSLMYDGFRVSPRKHFGLYVHQAADFYHQAYSNDRWRIQAIPEAVKPLLHFDHVEWFGLDENDTPDPITSTHAELFSAARGESFEHSDGEIESFCTNGLWWWY